MLPLMQRIEDVRYECAARGWELETYLATLLAKAIKERLRCEPILVYVPIGQIQDVAVDPVQ